jgi:hypothetical protein
MAKKQAVGKTATVTQITQSILLIRDQKVILDADLAVLYGVETRVLLHAVKRYIERFPDDFIFQLTKQKYTILRSQIVTSREIAALRSQ